MWTRAKDSYTLYIGDYSDFRDETKYETFEDFENSIAYRVSINNILSMDTDDFIKKYAIEVCDDCISYKYDDPQYCCTKCWGSEKQDELSEKFIATLINNEDDIWKLDDESHENLRELFIIVFKKYGWYNYYMDMIISNEK